MAETNPLHHHTSTPKRHLWSYPLPPPLLYADTCAASLIPPLYSIAVRSLTEFLYNMPEYWCWVRWDWGLSDLLPMNEIFGHYTWMWMVCYIDICSIIATITRRARPIIWHVHYVHTSSSYSLWIVISGLWMECMSLDTVRATGVASWKWQERYGYSHLGYIWHDSLIDIHANLYHTHFKNLQLNLS